MKFIFIKLLFSLPFLLIKQWFAITCQKHFFQKNVWNPVLKKIPTTQISSDVLKKITHYYALFLPAVLGNSFCKLRGNKMLVNERYTCTYMGIISCLYDEFIDSKELSNHKLQEMLNGENTPQKISEAPLFEFCRHKILENINNKELLYSTIQKIYLAQIESKKQKTDELKPSELQKITFDKGGYSFQFYALAFFNELNPDELNAIYNLGALLQLENDAFDVYEDIMKGIHTLVTESIHIEQITQLYINQLKLVIKNFKKLSFKKRNINQFLITILLIVSRGMVSLIQLKKLENKTGGEFKIKNYSRKELICDMEKPKNIILWLKYFMVLTKNIYSV